MERDQILNLRVGNIFPLSLQFIMPRNTMYKGIVRLLMYEGAVSLDEVVDMAFVISFVVGLSLLLFFVVLPVCKFYRQNWQDNFDRELHHLKLRAVQRHYSALENLSWSEIEEHFDVEEAYNRIRC